MLFLLRGENSSLCEEIFAGKLRTKKILGLFLLRRTLFYKENSEALLWRGAYYPREADTGVGNRSTGGGPGELLAGRIKPMKFTIFLVRSNSFAKQNIMKLKNALV